MFQSASLEHKENVNLFVYNCCTCALADDVLNKYMCKYM